jgi:hypothetical protein
VLPGPRVALALAADAVCIRFALHEYHSPTGVDEGGYQFQARIFEAGRVVAIPLLGAMANVRNTPEELDYQNHVLTPRHGSRIFLSAGRCCGGGRLAARALVLNPLLTLLLGGSRIGSRIERSPIPWRSWRCSWCRHLFLSEGARRLSHLWLVWVLVRRPVGWCFAECRWCAGKSACGKSKSFNRKGR